MLFILTIIAVASGICLVPGDPLQRAGVRLPRTRQVRRLARFAFFFSLILICLQLKLMPFALILGAIGIAVDLMDRFKERLLNNDELKEEPHPGGPRREPPRAAPRGAMEPSEALSMLGLSDGASGEEVDAAYRRLIAQLHPDKGGTDYLAAKLNEARSVLKARIS